MALYDKINKISINREAIRLNARVLRLWTVPQFNNPAQIGSLELILIDEEGAKIQATVRKNLLHKFSSLLEEGSAYKFVYFSVVPNSGHYRATFHEFKLVFLFKTSVIKKESELLPLGGFTFAPFNEVLTYDDTYDNLIDVIGVLTAVFPERQYRKDGKITTMVTMELTDPSGKLEVALFGEYVDQLRNFLGGENVQVVVIIQLARVKTFRGKTVIQNSMNATKLMLNPDVHEAIEFRNSIAEHGIVDVEPMAVVLDNSREGLQAEFLKLHPKKTIGQLETIQEDGMSIVSAEIVGIICDSKWYYLACKCNRSVILKGNIHFCENCMVPVLQVTPKFKVKVEVTDLTDCAIFVLFDRDINLLIQKNCEDLLCETAEEVSENMYPAIFQCLIGKKMLFKVETKVQHGSQFEDSYPIRKVCYDEEIVEMFQLLGSNITPTKAVFAPAFPKMAEEMIDLGEPSSQDGSQFLVTPVYLGDDDCCITNVTPAKRKLDSEFLEIQEESSIVGKSSASALVAVKIEKE